MNDYLMSSSNYELRPNQSRAKNAVLFLKIILVLEIVSLISAYLQYALLNNADITEELAAANDSRQQIVGVLYLGVFIATAVTFINWFRRAYHNLGQLEENLAYLQKDTGISWFIPILNLYKPYKIMKDLYTKTQSVLEENGSASSSLSSLNTVKSWWILWVLISILGSISFRLSSNSDTIDVLLMVTAIDMIVNIISIPTAILAIQVIRNYQQTEPLLEEIAYQKESVLQ